MAKQIQYYYQPIFPPPSIQSVKIDQYSLKLYGGYPQNNKGFVELINSVEFKDKKQLEQFLHFVSSEKNINPEIKTRIDNVIVNFHPETSIQPKVNSLYNQMQSLIEDKLKQSQLLNKKLLILVGEDHNSWDSFALELLALDICKKNNIENFFAECSQKMLKIITQDNIPNFWARYKNEDHTNVIFKAALKNDMLVHLVDPLHLENITGKVTYKQRVDKINEVLLSANGDAIFCVGATHLFDIISQESLSLKYEMITFNTCHQDNTLEQYESYKLALLWDRKTLDRLQQESLISDPDDFASQDKLETLIDRYNMKNMYSFENNKVIDLFIDPDEQKVLGSLSQALDIATNTISAHNPGAPTLSTLDAMSDVEKQAQGIFYASPSWKMKCQQIYKQLISPAQNQENLKDKFAGLTKQELSYFSRSEKHLSDIVDIDLAGDNIINYQENTANIKNWDVHPDC